MFSKLIMSARLLYHMLTVQCMCRLHCKHFEAYAYYWLVQNANAAQIVLRYCFELSLGSKKGLNWQAVCLMHLLLLGPSGWVGYEVSNMYLLQMARQVSPLSEVSQERKLEQSRIMRRMPRKHLLQKTNNKRKSQVQKL